MKKIKLYNRDGANIWIEETSPFIYKLNVDSNHEYCLEYIRVIGDNMSHIKAVDPSGGPFISVGDKFENITIKQIIAPTIFKVEYND